MDESANGHNGQLFGEFAVVSTSTANSVTSQPNIAGTGSVLDYGASDDMAGSLIRISDDDPVVKEDRIIATNTNNTTFTSQTNTFTVTENWTTNPVANSPFYISFNNPTFGTSGAQAPIAYQATDASDNGFTANWEAIANAESITIDIAEDAAFTITVVTDIVVSDPTSDFFFVAEDLSFYANQKLYYRVRFTDGSFTSPYSDPIEFMITPGNALTFDGTDDYLTAANPNLTPPMTMEFWVKLNSTNTNSQILAQFGAGGIYIGRFTQGKVLAFFDASSSNNSSADESAISLLDDKWHHIAATTDGSTTRLYIDGAIAATHSETAITGATSLYLGANQGTASYMQGTIDEVRIWDDERTLTEINEFQYATLSGNEQDLISYYRFDETSGTTLADLAGDNDGTLTNMAGNEWAASGAMAPTIYQASDASDNGFTANWEAIANAESITIDIAEDAAFTTTVNTDISVSDPASDFFFVSENLSSYAGQKLYYRLRFSDGDFLSSYSEPVEFMITPGNALDFDGVDDFVLGQPMPFANNSFTLETWAKRNSTGSISYLFSLGAANPLEGLHIGFYTGDVFAFNFWGGANDLANGAVFTDTDWHHWAVTYDANTNARVIYLDGIVYDSDTAPADFQGTGNLYIGKRFDDASPFDGEMDEVRVWDYARSQIELQNDLYTTLSGNETGLLAYYRFDETTGITLPDLASNNDGTWNGTGGTNTAPNWTTSAAMQSTIAPSAPTDLIVYRVSDTQLALEWTDNSEGETDYLIERSSTEDFSSDILEVTYLPANSNFHFVSDDVFRRYYRVTAINANIPSTAPSLVEFGSPEAHPGYAMDFNGISHYVQLPDLSASSLTPSGSFTIEAWVNSSVGGNSNILVIGADATNQNVVLKSGSGNVFLVNSSSKPGPSSTIPSTDGLWHHLAATYDGINTLTLYVDGNFIDEDNTFAFNLDLSKARIGVGSDALTNYWNGQIDEVKIWDIEKTDFSDRYEPLQGDEPNLVAYYPFEEDATGAIVFDRSVNANNGTPSGSPTYGISGASGPSDLVTRDSPFAIHLQWVDNTDGETGFIIERASDPAFTTNFFDTTVGADVTSFTDNNSLALEGDHYYRVRAAFPDTPPSAWTYTKYAQAKSDPGLAYSFDGVDDQILVSSNSLNFDGDFTLSFWVRRSQDFNDATNRLLVGKKNLGVGEDVNAGYGVIIGHSSAAFGAHAPYIALGDGTNHESFHPTSYSLPLNNWVQVSFVYDALNHLGSWYADGSLLPTTKVSTSNITSMFNTEPLIIGGATYDGPMPQYFAGEIDEVRIWNTARTPQEILDNKDFELDGNEPGLVAYYQFDEKTGTTLYDRSVNNNNGVNNGATISDPSGAMQTGTNPDAPAGVTTTKVSTTEIMINWTDGANEQGYRIIRADNEAFSVNVEQIGEVAADVTTFTDNIGVDKGAYYLIQSYNGAITEDSGAGEFGTTVDHPGTAMSFDGDDLINMDVDLITAYQDFTVEAWINRSSGGNDIIYHQIVGERPGDFLVFVNAANQLTIQRWNGGVSTANFGPSSLLVPEGWVHVSAGFEGTNIRYCIDGTCEVIAQSTGTSGYGDYRGIGNIDFPGSNLNGQIDELRIWNDARSEAEIINNRYTPLQGTEPNLVAYYTFDEDGGTMVVDRSANQNDGTINGATFVESNFTSPTGVYVTQLDDSNLQLTWTDNSSEDSFSILRSTDAEGTGATEIGTVGQGVTTFTDNIGLNSAGFYVVEAVTGDDRASSEVAFGTTEAYPGHALAFDGVDDYVDFGNDPSLNFDNTDAFTFEAWVNTSASGTQSIFSNYDGAKGYNFEIRADGDVWFSFVSTSSSNQIRSFTTYYTLNDGNWHHVAVSYDGGNSASGVSIYVDGISSAVSSDFDNLSASTISTANTTSGAAQNGTIRPFSGQIDELKIWSITKSDFSDRFAKPTVSDPNLVAYYSFDENTGTTLIDKSVNGNNGTLLNGTTNTPAADGVTEGPLWTTSALPLGSLTYAAPIDIVNNPPAYDGSPYMVNEVSLTDVLFRPDGLRMFVCGQDGQGIEQYDLTVPFDVTTGVTFGDFVLVNAQTSQPTGIAFNHDGSKLYLSSSNSTLIYQYSLSAPYDISAGISHDGSPMSIAAQSTNSSDVVLHPSGTKIYVLNDGNVFQYGLSAPFETTTGVTFEGSIDVSTQESTASGLAFDASGTKLFVIGFNSDAVHQYTLNTPFDVTGGSVHDGSFSVATEQGLPMDLTFSPDGTRLFVAGGIGQQIQQYSFDTNAFAEASANDGSLEGALIVSLQNHTFVNASTVASNLTISNLPAGLTPAVALSVGNTVATITLSGSAIDHESSNSVSDLELSISDGAFTGNNASSVTNATAFNTGLGISFDNAPIKILSTTPTVNAFNIAANDNIVLTFDATLNGATLTAQNIRIWGTHSGLATANYTGGGTTTLTINPTNDFMAGEKVYVSITNGISSESGNIAEPYTLTFNIETASFQGAFVKQTTALEGVVDGAAAWADYDGDGDLDVAVSGWDFDYSIAITKIFNNSAGTFTDIGGSLLGVYEGSLDWGDFDNDGDLDLFVTGIDELSNTTATLYENNAGTFTDIGGSFQGVYFSEADWGDFDNDGDLDLIVQGQNQATPQTGSTNIYRNDAGSFVNINAGLPERFKGGVAWGDYDGDGDLDFANNGYNDNAAARFASIYENNGGVFTDIAAGFEGTVLGFVEWGDYDNDGDLDLVVSGANTNDNAPRIYRNDAGSFVDINAALLDNSEGEIAWGDYDGDGDLDLVINGSGETNDPTTTLYINNSGSYVNSGIQLENYLYSTVDWGDYDNDGDLDLLLTGTDDFNGGRISLYSNTLEPPTIYNATNVTNEGFTPNLVTPSGAVDLIVDVSTDPAFGSFAAQEVSVGVSGGVDINLALTSGTNYYYRAKTDFGGGEISSYYESNPFMVQPGNALPFTGDDYVEVPDNVLLEPTGDFTIEFWLKTSVTGNKIIIEKGNSNAEYSVQQFSGDKLGLNVNGGAMRTNGSYNDGFWHHVVMVYRGTNDGTIYVDGVEDVDTGTINLGVPAYSFGRLTIGDRRFGGSFNIEGSIDEIRIWDDERSLLEINENRYTTLIGSEDGLLAYYQFDHTSGTTLSNLSDNISLDGELNNMAGSEWTASKAMLAPFVTTWITSDGTITLPTFGGSNDYDLVWTNLTNAGVGNGSISGQNVDYTITGLTNGDTYELELVGKLDRIFFSGGGEKDKIQSVEQWGDVAWTDFSMAFTGCTNLVINATDEPDLSGVTSFNEAFAGCTSLVGTQMNDWDVSNITSMFGTFQNATSFGGAVSSWDVSGVTDMTNLFAGATSFNQPLNNWDVSNVTSMFSLLDGATSFDQQLGAWDISNVTGMNQMLNNVAMSSPNYDQTLEGWATLDGGAGETEIPTGITLHATNVSYGALGETSRNTLINTYGWTINGDISLALPAPTDVVAYATSSTTIKLDWTDNAGSETGYLVESADDFEFTTNLQSYGVTAADAETTTITVGANGSYFLRVTTLDGGPSFEASESATTFATTVAFPGYALDLDGTDDYVNIPEGGSMLSGLSVWSFEAWIKVPTPLAKTHALMSVGGSSPVVIQLSSSGLIQIRDQTNTANFQTVTGVYPDDGVWHHVAITNNGNNTGNGAVYIDGSPVSLGTNGFTTFGTLTTEDMHLGSWDLSVNEFLQGEMDEVRFWNTARTQTEIENNRFQALNGNETGLIAYFPFDENTGSTAVDRSANINDGILTNFPGDGSEWVMSGAAIPPAPFITTWSTSDGQITIPTNSGSYTYNYSVTWSNLTNPGTGEGTLSSQTGDAVLTGLENGGVYQIEISGTFPAIYFNNTGDKDKIVTIEQWGDIKWASMNSAFRGCSNLEYNAMDSPDLSEVNQMNFMFAKASILNGDLSNWDVSTIAEMRATFSEASSFNGNITNWDVSSVNDMTGMFQQAILFNQNISGWNTASLTNSSQMFRNASAFNQDVSGWSLASVTDASSMFRQAISFNQNLSGWNVSQVTNMSYMFNGATSFNSDISNWDVSLVEGFSNMFDGAIAFNQDVSGWDVSSGVYFSYMFDGSVSFDQNLGSWDIGSALFMTNMLTNSAMSTTNYEATLAGWADDNSGTETIPTGITLGANGLTYTSTGQASRDILTGSFSWAIIGDALLAPEIEVTGLGANIIGNGDVSPSTLDGTNFETGEIGASSVTRTFTINNSGTGDLNLGPGAVSISGDTDFTVSAQPGTVVSSAGSSTFTVAFDASVAGVRSATVSIANDDADESPFTFNIQGTGALPAPTTQATNVAISSVTENTAVINWTNGNGSSRIVTVFEGNGSFPSPVDNTTYTANSDWSMATAQAGTDWKVVYVGTGSTVSITGLNPSQQYTVAISEYNGGAGSEKYNTSDAGNNPGFFTTVTPDMTAPSGYTLSNVFVNNATDEFDFQIDGAEVGATYEYAISSDGGGTPVSGTGTISNTTEIFGAISTIGLNYGTLTITVTLTDAASNEGSPVSETVSYMSPVSPPVLSGVSVTPDETFADVDFTLDVTADVYYVITESSTAPSVTQIIAGQDQNSATAASSGLMDNLSGTVNRGLGSGSWGGNDVGLSRGVGYYLHMVADAGSSNYSDISSTLFTTQYNDNTRELTSEDFTNFNGTLNSLQSGTFNFSLFALDLSNATVTDNAGFVKGGTGNAIILSDGGDYFQTGLITEIERFGFEYRSSNGSEIFVKASTSLDGVTFNDVVIEASTNNTSYESKAYELSSPFDGYVRIEVSTSGSGTIIVDDFFVETTAAPEGVVTISNGTPATGGNVEQGSVDNVIYDFQWSVAGGDVTTTGLFVTPTGSYAASDFDQFTLWASVDVSGFANATEISSTTFASGNPPIPDGSLGWFFSDTYLDGSTIYLYITADISSSATIGNTLTISAPGFDSNFGFDPGTTADGMINQGTTITIQPVADVTPPSGYTIQNLTIDNIGNELSLDISNAEVGTSYEVTISSDGGGADVVVPGSVVNVTQSVTNLGIGSLGYGTLTVSVVLTDPAMNAGNIVSETVAFAAPDLTAPSGYSISNISVDNVNDELNFQIDNAEIGTTYSYSITSDGGGTPVSSSGTVNNATETFGGISIGGLGYGTLTLSVGLTDAASNSGTPVTETVSYEDPNASVPTVAISTISLVDGDVAQGTLGELVYKFKFDVTNAPITTSGLYFGLSGTFDPADFETDGFVLLYNTVSDDINSAAIAGLSTYNSGTPLPPNSIGWLLTETFAVGETYFYVTADISNAALVGNDFSISAPVLDNFGVDDPKEKNDGGLLGGQVFTVTAGVSSNPFITTWSTTDGTITIPTSGSPQGNNGPYDYDIFWTNLTNPGVGDGFATRVNGDHTITGLANNDVYEIEISGDFSSIYMSNGSEALKLLSIEQWGDIEWYTFRNAFQGCDNMVYNATDAPDLSLVTSLGYMFDGAILFNGDLSNWDVSTITSLSNTFSDASSFNGNITNWNTSNVTVMAGTFYGASSFNQDLSGWNTSNVSTLNVTFADAIAFNQNINSWDVSNVTSFQGAFDGATNFNQPLDQWDLSSALSLSSMFRDATSFDQDLSGWVIPSTVTTMANMFRATPFSFDISGWNVSGVSDFSFMFWEADNFNHSLNNWDMSSATTLNSMFANCDIFNQDLNSWNTSSVTNMRNVFGNSPAFNGNISSWDVSSVTTMSQMFYATTFNGDLSSWDVSAVTDMSFIFFQSSFNSDISSWVTSSVVNMNGAFREMPLFDQDLSTLDMSNVTSASNMLDNSGLSIANYDATLIGWASQTLQPGVSFHASGLEYCAGSTSRQSIIDNFTWTISGDALLCPQIAIGDISDDNLVGLTESTALSISGTTTGIEDGQNVQVVLNSTENFNTTVSSDMWSVVVDASGLGDGTINVDVTSTDVAGNEATNSTTFTFDGLNPVFTSATSETIDENITASTLIYTAAATDAGTVTYTLSGTDETAFTLNASTGDLSINASPDFETQASYEVVITATDAASNTTDLTLTITVTDLDENAPVGYSLSGVIVDNLIDELSFDISGAEVGATYDVIVSSDGGGTDVTSTGIVSNATEFIGPIDISGLGYGTLTIDYINSQRAITQA
ncbi:MAG: BspA family leucine-rich repeat surface protein [Cyclobacteriaceae bacterium]